MSDSKKIKLKKLSKTQVIIIVVIAILLVILVPSGIYCGVHSESPAQMINDITTSDDEQIIAKWQNENGSTAYEFYDDGTYDNYITNFSFTGEYSIDGNILILTNPNSNSYVEYKFSINGDKLNMTLESESGKDPEDKEKFTFDKVEHFNMKSLTDLLQDAADEDETTTQPTTRTAE